LDDVNEELMQPEYHIHKSSDLHHVVQECALAQSGQSHHACWDT